MAEGNLSAKASAQRRAKLADLLLSQIVPLAASSIMTLATALILGPAGRGELAIVLSGGGLVGAIGFLSLHIGIIRAQRDGDITAVRRGWTIAASGAGTVALAGVCAYFFLPSLSAGLFTQTTVFLVACGGALVLFNLVVLRTRQGLGDSRTFRNSWFLQSLIFPIIGIPVALLTNSAALVACCWYLALIISTAYAMAAAHSELDVPAGGRVAASRIVTTSLAAHAGTVGQQLLFRGDVVVLGFLVSASSVGVYSIAMPIAGLVWVFSEALSLLAFDSGNRSRTTGDRQLEHRRLVKANFMLGGLGAVVIGLASWLVLPQILPQYSSAVPIILLLLPGVLIQGWARIGLSSVLTTGAVRAPVVIGVASAALSLMYIPFVVSWGILGAAVASTVIYALQTLVVILVMRKLTKTLGDMERRKNA